MAETKPTRRRKKSSASKVDATPVAPVIKAEDLKPELIESKAAKAKPIEVSKAKVLPKDKKYTKIVAIKNSSGRMGHERFSIKDGETYTFPTLLANWLIETGRAK